MVINFRMNKSGLKLWNLVVLLASVEAIDRGVVAFLHADVDSAHMHMAERAHHQLIETKACSSNEEYDENARKCICRDGFYGMACQMCSHNNTCAAVKPHAVCEKDMLYRNTTIIKSYECELDDSLQILLSDGAASINCDTRYRNCSMAVYKKKDTVLGEHVIDCDFTECSFLNSGLAINCDLIMCHCGKACSAITKTIVENSFSNKPVNVTVDKNHIKIDIVDAMLAIGATCQASSCEASGGVPSDEKNSSIVYISLLLLGMVFVVAVISFWSCYYCFHFGSFDDKALPTISMQSSISLPGKVLEFQNLTCKIVSTNTMSSVGSTERTILSNVSGSVKRGSVLGLMGPSGAGKSSLLNALAGVYTGATTKLTGGIFIDGKKRCRNFRRMIAYVQQDDCLFSTLTVRECIEYSALLRLPHEMPMRIKHARVSRVIEELGLLHVANTRIGSAGQGRGISGGERRRVSIGMELVTSPQIIFLDEPTSGLDSSAAYCLVQLVKKLAEGNRVVVVSIHQPSSKSFFLLDQVLLLAMGNPMYLGRPSNAKAYFKEAGFECPENENIADFVVDVISDENNIPTLFEKYNTKEPEEDMLPDLTDGERNDIDFDASESPDDAVGVEDSLLSTEELARSLKASNRNTLSVVLQESAILFQRTGRNILRNRSLLVTHVALSVGLGIFGGQIFHHVTPDLPGFQNRSGAFYFILTFFGFSSFSTMDLFIAERDIFKRETGAAYYGPFSYFLAKYILDSLLLRIIPVVLFSSIFYWLMGLQPTFEHFLIFVITLALFNGAAGSLSVCISIIAPTVGVANLVATVVFLVMLLFGGFLLNTQTMPSGVEWLRHISIFNYGFELLMTNELRGLEMTFHAPGYPTVPVKGDIFLKTLGMDYKNQFYDLLALGFIGLGFSCISYLLLVLQVPQAVHLSMNQPRRQGARA